MDSSKATGKRGLAITVNNEPVDASPRISPMVIANLPSAAHRLNPRFVRVSNLRRGG